MMIEQKFEQLRNELAHAKTEAAQLGQRLGTMKESREFWFGECRAAEIERDQARQAAQEQSDEVQEHWLSPVEAEGLKRQLKHAVGTHRECLIANEELEMKLDNAAEGEAAIVKAAKALLKLSPIGVTRLTLSRARRNLLEALEHRSDAAAKLLERLAGAERSAEVLERERDEWRMSWENVTADLLNTRGQLAEAELAAHVHDKACGELAQTVRTEQALRREAEKRTERVLRQAAQITHLTLNDCGVPNRDDNGNLANVNTRILWLNQRAERAEALAGTLAEVHAMLNCSPEHPWHGCTAQTVCNEAHYHNHVRGARELLEKVLEGETPTNTQALAALVTEETAALMERLAVIVLDNSSDIHFVVKARYARNAKAARKLAAQIREALDDSQA